MNLRAYFQPKLSLALVLGLLFLLIQANTVGAAGRDRLNWVAGCNGFTSQGGGIVLDRDNTGQGRESFIIVAEDGNGTVIFGPVSESSFVGSSVYIAPGVGFEWTTAPRANPILLSVISPAGNGLPEQTVYATVGVCAGLEFVADQSVRDRSVNDFSPSPSVPINGTPPRPTNPDGIGRTEVGYLLVGEPATVNLRSGDGPQYTLVGQVEQAEELLVIGRNDDRSWWFVQVGGVRGWVNAQLVIVRGDLTDAPVVPVEGEIFVPRFFIFLPNPIYTAATDRGAVVCTVSGGLEYAVIGKNPGGTWFLIDAPCGTGWISGDLGAIRNSGDLAIPIVQG